MQTPIYSPTELMRLTADFIEEYPERYAFMETIIPDADKTDCTACMIGWAAAFSGIDWTLEDEVDSLICDPVPEKIFGMEEDEFYNRLQEASPGLDWYTVEGAPIALRALANGIDGDN